jgi:DNA-binding transcriptional LysR family regulator
VTGFLDNQSLLDSVHLRTFLDLVETTSFTRTADRLNISQSTASLHLRKLETQLGQALFNRDTHSVEITEHGELLVGLARTILDTNTLAFSRLSASAVRGRVRFGASEDFVLGRLPDVLRTFRHSYPLVDLELTVGLSAVLHRRLLKRELDLVLAKRVAGETHGRLVFRDQMVWLAHASFTHDPTEPVPLVAYPPPSVSRSMAIAALDAQHRAWRIACTATSLNGLFAAASAGLGVLAHARDLGPASLRQVGPELGLPDLGGVDFVLLSNPRADGGPSSALADMLLAHQRALQAG